MGKIIDLTGQRFGKLTVVQKSKSKNGRRYWECKCDCGNTTFVSTANLNGGKVKSCGCSWAKDLKGKRFGKWLVIERDNSHKTGGSARWICRCDCGTIRSVSSDTLTRGDSKSCGCSWQHDLTGKRFGRLVVLERKSIECNYSSNTTRRKIFYLCKCDCGNYTTVDSSRLLCGDTTSCGCYHKELLSKRVTTHGASKTRLYRIWASMIDRCNPNRKSKNSKNYSERGISVCEDWKKFENFQEWALNNGYDETLTIERKDVNRNYCPENCTWIPKSEQVKNTRRNIFVTIDGQTKILKQWTNLMGWPYGRYSARYERKRPIFLEDELEQIKEKIRSEKDA